MNDGDAKHLHFIKIWGGSSELMSCPTSAKAGIANFYWSSSQNSQSSNWRMRSWTPEGFGAANVQFLENTENKRQRRFWRRRTESLAATLVYLIGQFSLREYRSSLLICHPPGAKRRESVILFGKRMRIIFIAVQLWWCSLNYLCVWSLKKATNNYWKWGYFCYLIFPCFVPLGLFHLTSPLMLVC